MPLLKEGLWCRGLTPLVWRRIASDSVRQHQVHERQTIAIDDRGVSLSVT